MSSIMPHDLPADEMNEQLTLHALGLLEGEEAEQMEAHLLVCSTCANEWNVLREAAAAVSLASPPVPPPPGLRDKVIAITSPQVWKNWSDAAPGDMHLVRGSEGQWQKVREGVYAKQLYVDRTRDLATMLVRMEPGAKYVPHRHAAPEQCFVLEGDIRDGEDVCYAGDFQVLAPGSVHGAQWTQDGCTVLIVSSLHDELLV